ncbi:hypothetical protein [Streptomyces sp. NPDC059452]|uniref:hypothetical protein n=1 Tax=Streptomyces sp. NPDC059452 TaxID=3346835 RepID=UPI0036BF9311
MTEPPHGTTYNQPVFNQNGGVNIGINYGSVGAEQDPELRAAVLELTRQLRLIEDRLTPDQARTVEEALPVLSMDRAAMTERGVTLARLAQIANAVGPAAEQAGAALGRLLGLLG